MCNDFEEFLRAMILGNYEIDSLVNQNKGMRSSRKIE